jgi:hypothetical protein
MSFDRAFGTPSMRLYPYTSPVRRSLDPHEQIDIGEYITHHMAGGYPLANIYVDYEFINPLGGKLVLHEAMCIHTTEHWVFLKDEPYDASRSVRVKRIGPDSGVVHTSLKGFLHDMAKKNVARYVIARAVTLPPPSPDAPPAIGRSDGTILDGGSYRVFQNGKEVGAILVTKQAEHWGVARSYDIQIGFDLEPVRNGWNYAQWAAHVNSCFDQCIYWVVTSENGKLPRA